MQHTWGVRVLCCCLAVPLLVGEIFAETRGAMLYGVGTTVNGAAVPRASAVLAGDRIVTSASGAATLAARGSRVLVASASSVTYHGASVELTSGTLSVATSGLITQAGEVRIAPVGNTARYSVNLRHGALTIIATEGALAVSMNGTTTSLPAGTSWQVATTDQDETQGESAQGQDKKEKKDRKKGGAAVVVPRTVMIGTAVAVTAAVAATAIATTGTPASPSSR